MFINSSLRPYVPPNSFLLHQASPLTEDGRFYFIYVSSGRQVSAAYIRFVAILVAKRKHALNISLPELYK